MISHSHTEITNQEINDIINIDKDKKIEKNNKRQKQQSMTKTHIFVMDKKGSDKKLVKDDQIDAKIETKLVTNNKTVQKRSYIRNQHKTETKDYNNIKNENT